MSKKNLFEANDGHNYENVYAYEFMISRARTRELSSQQEKHLPEKLR